MGVRWAVFMLAAALTVPVPAPAQNAGGSGPKAVVKQPSDFSGMWDFPDFNDAGETRFFTREEPQMLPWAAKRYQEIRKGRTFVRPDMGREDLDPSQYPYCLPYGIPRSYVSLNAFEIIQTPNEVSVDFESNNRQRIYTDGRKLPKGTPLSYMGQSVGRWEGDTLAVETIDLSPLSWIDRLGHPHTDALRVEQRMRLTDPDTLEISFLFDDPKTYVKPWGGTRIYKRVKRNPVLIETFVCEDTVRKNFSQNVLEKMDNQ